MILAISLNKISFTVLQSYILQNNSEKFIVLYDKRRISLDDININNNNVKYIKINRLVIMFFALLSLIGKVDKLFIPHHILGRIGNIIRIFAKDVHYIDDGMDTLRDKPKNFDLSRYDESSIYYTFKEYKYFGKWLQNKKIEQIATIKDLIEDKPAYKIDDGILVVESPGLSVSTIEQNNKKMYLFQHPSPLKQIKWKRDFTKIDSSVYSVENTILNMQSGEVYIGETMSLIISIYIGLLDDVKIICQLNSLNNLSCVIKIVKERANLEIIDTS